MIEKLERDGKLTPGKSKLIEMTSGSTGKPLQLFSQHVTLLEQCSTWL